MQCIIDNDQVTLALGLYFTFVLNCVSVVQVTKLSSQKVKDEILKFFVSENILYKQVSNLYFQQLIKWIEITNGELLLVSRKMICAHLAQKFDIAAADLWEVFEGEANAEISIALNIWASCNRYSFISMYSTRIICSSGYF